jgi:uncharacterized protein YwgA
MENLKSNSIVSEEVKEKLDENTLIVILYLIEKLDGVLGKTHLQKILFLTDLLSVKKFKKPITNLQFEKNHYGPYCSEVNQYIELLKNKKYVEAREFPLSNGAGIFVRYYFTGKDTSKKLLYKKITPEKIVLIDDVVSSYGNVSLQEILDVVYSLATVKESENHTPLEMAKIINDDNEEVQEIDIF